MSFPQRQGAFPGIFSLAALGVFGLAIGFVAGTTSPFLIVVGVVGVVGLYVITTHLELGALAMLFMFFTNASMVLNENIGVPSVAKPLVLLLVGLIIGRRLVLREHRPVDPTQALALLGFYGFATGISILYADYPSIVQGKIVEFVKDALMVVIMVMLITNFRLLRLSLWAMLAAGFSLGTLTIYQRLTGTFANDYWGFAQGFRLWLPGDEFRATGPLGDPNIYGQALVCLVPLAMERAWNEKTLLLRIVALAVSITITATILLTYSRATFLCLLLALIAVLFIRRPTMRTVLSLAAAAIIVFQFIPDQYTERIYTVLELRQVAETGQAPTGSFENRLGEMRAALAMFLDHPILGVGSGHYPKHFQSYNVRIHAVPRGQGRMAHCLYCEVAAERGILGLAALGVLLFAVARNLLTARSALRQQGLHKERDMVSAIGVGLLAYLANAVFLHETYSQYFWMLIGLTLILPAAVSNMAAQAVDDSLPEEVRTTS